MFAKAAEPPFQVYAFEPEPANFAMLKENVCSGKYRERIVPIQAAVGEQNEVVELWRNSICQGDRRVITPEFKAALSAEDADLVEVPIVSLDSFIASQPPQPLPCFVKMRVQGYEIPVCLGMRHILDNSPNLTVAMTYAPDYIKALGYEPARLLDIFESRGFHFYAVNDRGRLQVLANPKPEIDELLASSNSFVKSQLPLPEPTAQQIDPGPQLYIELLLTRKTLYT
ncbi:MAG: FkbM family methyltransferase [Acidobacteria bacterium]|nr:FkbM family methyltransferase [Acidobacteriota bacterium]